MTSDENIGSSNPSGSNQFPLIVDEDNANPSSPLLNMPNNVQAVQPSNEIIQKRGSTNQLFGIILRERELMRKTGLSAIIVRYC